jgi:hypothetical protein
MQATAYSLRLAVLGSGFPPRLMPGVRCLVSSVLTRGGRMAEMFANAIGYEQLVGRWSVRLAPLYAEFAQLRDAGKILDVGCGPSPVPPPGRGDRSAGLDAILGRSC